MNQTSASKLVTAQSSLTSHSGQIWRDFPKQAVVKRRFVEAREAAPSGLQFPDVESNTPAKHTGRSTDLWSNRLVVLESRTESIIAFTHLAREALASS